MIHVDGKKDPELRDRARAGNLDGPYGSLRFLEYAKTATILATQINEAFEVDTLEGLHTGKAGDWLAIGIHGEMYPIDDAVMKASYAPVPAQPAPLPTLKNDPTLEEVLERGATMLARATSGSVAGKEELIAARGALQAALMLVRVWVSRL